MATPNEILDQGKDEFAACIVFGIGNDGTTKLLASMDNVAFAHWMLNKAMFELCLFERSKAMPPQSNEPAAA